MTTTEAQSSILERQTSANALMNKMMMYLVSSSGWSSDVKTAKIAEIKTDATSIGLDLGSWEG